MSFSVRRCPDRCRGVEKSEKVKGAPDELRPSWIRKSGEFARGGGGGGVWWWAVMMKGKGTALIVEYD